MEEIYRSCPEFENNDYILRMVSQEDRLDLLKVYSDKEAVSFFSESENCRLALRTRAVAAPATPS